MYASGEDGRHGSAQFHCGAGALEHRVKPGCCGGSQQPPSPTSDLRGYGTFLVDDGSLGRAIGRSAYPFKVALALADRDNARFSFKSGRNSRHPGTAETCEGATYAGAASKFDGLGRRQPASVDSNAECTCRLSLPLHKMQLIDGAARRETRACEY